MKFLLVIHLVRKGASTFLLLQLTEDRRLITWGKSTKASERRRKS
jgi:hypothetical protein